MKIEIGHCYLTRGGKIVGPVEKNTKTLYNQPFMVEVDGNFESYNVDGTYYEYNMVFTRSKEDMVEDVGTLGKALIEK